MFLFDLFAGALSRALSLQETIDKHSKIQALAGLICTMIESCPSTQSQQQTLPLYRQLQVSFAPLFKNFSCSPLNVLTKKWGRI
jgi:hypothetical protein